MPRSKKDTRRVTGLIDGIIERHPDKDSGWGSYVIKLEGLDGKITVDVPLKVNAEYELGEGDKITIVEQDFGGNPSWIVHSLSEFITGEPFPYVSEIVSGDDSEDFLDMAPTKRKRATSVSQPKIVKKERAVQRRESFDNNKPKVSATTTDYNSWNQYQIDVRDPSMRMQAILTIVGNLHTKCIEQGISTEGVVEDLMLDAEKLDAAVMKYLGL